MGKLFRPLRLVPESILEQVMKFFPPIPRGIVRYRHDNNSLAGWVIFIPITGYQFLTLPRKFVVGKIIQAIQVAEKLGVEIVGLGEFTSSITKGGKNLVGKVGCQITNGNSLTAGITFEAVKKACLTYGIEWEKERVAVVGATGSVGTAVSLLLAEEGIPLMLVARGKAGLEELKASIQTLYPHIPVGISQNVEDIRKTRVVVVATSSTSQIIKAEHLANGALVYDITQPRNTSPSLLEQRKDVLVIDGGVIATPGVNYGMDIGLPPEQAYACLAETMLLALDGRNGNFVGNATPEDAKGMMRLMINHSAHFRLAPFQSFGTLLEASQNTDSLQTKLYEARF